VSRIVFNPFTGQFDQVRTSSIDVDSAGVIEAAVVREIDSATLPGGIIFNAIDSDFDVHLDAELDSGGKIKLHTDSTIALGLDSGGIIQLAIDSDFRILLNTELDSGGLITLAIDSDFGIRLNTELDSGGLIKLHTDSTIAAGLDSGGIIKLAIDSDAKVLIDSAAKNNDGGYEFSGGFTDRTTGRAGVTDLGADVQYTTLMADSAVFLRFGFDSAAQDSNDNPYWSSPTPSPSGGVGLFGGKYMPAGVNSLFDFNFDSSTYTDSGTYSGIKVTGATGSYDFSECSPGDFALVRFDFNVTPQEANCTLEVGLIWQTRDANDNPTFTFFLAGEPQFYGQGSVGKTFLSRPLISAYFASDEDVNARALPAIRCDRQILIQPLTTLVTIVR
jgi:hypothetical protein